MKPSVFQLGDVTFDPTTRDVTDKDGKTVQLRNKSKSVLALLLETPNETVTKADILGKVWRETTVSDESLVQCIADIRRIIGPEARKIIETVPREGYRANIKPKSATPKRSPAIAVVAVGLIALVGSIWVFWPGQAQPPVTQAEVNASGVASQPPGTVHKDAYLEVLQGRVSANRLNLQESLVAERHFRRAIEIDPSYARAYAELGTVMAVRFENDWTVLHEADREKALFYAEKAVELDPDLWLGHYALGRLCSVFSELERAEEHLRKAMSLKPDNEDARAYLGVVLNFQGKTDDALAVLEQAVAAHPDPPYWYLFGLGHALFNARRYDDAERVLHQCLQVSDQSPYCLRYLIATHGQKGDQEGADHASQIYADMGLDLSTSAILSLMTFHHPDDLAQLEAGLRRAGLPD